MRLKKLVILAMPVAMLATNPAVVSAKTLDKDTSAIDTSDDEKEKDDDDSDNNSETDSSTSSDYDSNDDYTYTEGDDDTYEDDEDEDKDDKIKSLELKFELKEQESNGSSSDTTTENGTTKAEAEDDLSDQDLEPEVTCEDEDIDIMDVTWSIDPSEWKRGDIVECCITISTSDKYFYHTKVSLDNAALLNAEYTPYKVTDWITIYANYGPINSALGTTENLTVEEKTYIGEWDRVIGADKYEVMIKVANEKESDKSYTVVTPLTYIDLAPYLKERGDSATFTVKAIAEEDNKHYYVSGAKSGESDEITPRNKPTEGAWSYSDGIPSMFSKKKSSGKSETETQTGWFKFLGKDFYADDIGKVKTNQWVDYNDGRYYLDYYGVMQTGWVNINGDIYLTDSTGNVMRNTVKEYNPKNEEKTWANALENRINVYTDENGKAFLDEAHTAPFIRVKQSDTEMGIYEEITDVKNGIHANSVHFGRWTADGKYEVLKDNTGYILTNSWLYDVNSSRWFYLDGEGNTLKGWHQLDGNTINDWYYFDKSSGKALKYWIEETDSKTKVKTWYYMNPESSALTTGEVTYRDKIYNLGTNGAYRLSEEELAAIEKAKAEEAALEAAATQTSTEKTVTEEVADDSNHGPGVQ